MLLAALLLATVAMVPVARLRIEPSAPPGAASSGFRGADRYTVPRLRAPDSVRVPGLPGSLPVVVGRWLARSPLVASLLAVALLLALAATGSPGLSFAAALLVPVAVVTGMSTAEARVAGTLERTTASLLRPRPALGFGWQLALLAIVPTLPSLLHVSTLQAGTAALAIVTVAMWLTWTHRCISRPVLGESIVALLWYLDVLNHPPAPFDIFGLWHADVRTFLLALAASAAVSLAVWWHDRVGPAPRRALSPDRS